MFLFFQFLIFLLITVCDSIEQTGKNITTTCYLLHQLIPDIELAEQLLYLGNYTEKLSPVISAAGFFNINRSILSTIISTLLAYLIVCIQFSS